jgi:cob(I)alamin adenosyltransferase
MKLYTRRGDGGETGLASGMRVGKDSLRVKAYGHVDELNSHIGLARAACGDANASIHAALFEAQHRLFDLGAELATPRQTVEAAALNLVSAAHVEAVERQIDAACERVPPLRQFILPGGTELAARLHLARTVCRRAERHCVALGRVEATRPMVITYLNRLSDLLFALARLANHQAGVDDTAWEKLSRAE